MLQNSKNIFSIVSGFPSASQRCGHLKGQDMNYKFETSPCSYAYKFVCQKNTTAYGRFFEQVMHFLPVRSKVHVHYFSSIF